MWLFDNKKQNQAENKEIKISAEEMRAAIDYLFPQPVCCKKCNSNNIEVKNQAVDNVTYNLAVVCNKCGNIGKIFNNSVDAIKHWNGQ